MKLYAVQMDLAWEDHAANHAAAERMLREANCPRGALAFLPEMFATGFSMNVATIAEDPQDGPTVRFLARCAQDLGIYLAGGFAARTGPNQAQNRLAVFAPSGERIADYAKIHPFSFSQENRHYLPGNEISRFSCEDLTVSPFICYDLRFPEAFRLSMQGDPRPDVLAVIANWPAARESHWVALLRARAIENQSYVIGVNRCGNDPANRYSGRSLIIDPRGETLADAGDGGGVISAEIDLDALREWRTKFPALTDMHRLTLDGIA